MRSIIQFCVVMTVALNAIGCNDGSPISDSNGDAKHVAGLASQLADATGHQQMLVQVDDSEDGRFITITKFPATVDDYRSFLISDDGSVEEFAPP